jgi:hypothetical protein
MSQKFVGVWKLISLEYHLGDEVIYPKTPFRGYIMYTPNAYMSVHLMAEDRRPFASPDWLNGTREEYADAGTTYLGYCGTYEVHEDTIIHHIELSSFPNWVGTDFVRYYTFHDDTLTLQTPPMLVDGHTQIAQLVWQNVP